MQDARDRDDRPASARSGRKNFPERSSADPGAKRGASSEDPQLLGAAITRLLAERGWQQQVAVGSAFGRWEEIVGPELAAHARPDGFDDGELVIVADSTAWATQVRLLAATLVRRLNTDLGDGTVRRVKVRGPTPLAARRLARPRQQGAWRHVRLRARQASGAWG